MRCPNADRHDGAGNLHYSQNAPRALSVWAQWDANWYLLIADHGYGLVTFFKAPGDFQIQLYQPKYEK